MNSEFIPSISCITSTCPSQYLPAPMPMVGMLNDSLTSFARVAGIFSSTIAKQPALSSSFASLLNLFASSSSKLKPHVRKQRVQRLAGRNVAKSLEREKGIEASCHGDVV